MKTEEILPYDKLYDLYIVKKLSDANIAKQFDLTLGQVHRLRNKYLIKAIQHYERHPKQLLDPQEESLLVGLMLGDGHISLDTGPHTNPCVMLEQTVKHREYIFWLYEALKDWLPPDSRTPRQAQHRHQKTGKIYHSYAFNTVNHPAFFKCYHAFYKGKKKTLNDLDYIASKFNVLSFAVWLMDDGFLSGNCKRIAISTNSFTKDEVNWLRELLHTKFGFKTWICKRTNTSEITYEIAFDRRSSIEASNLLRDFVLPSMQYKLIPSETTNGTELNIPKV